MTRRGGSVVQHLPSLPVWERKARRMTLKPAGPRTGSYTADGRIAGFVTWRAIFEYELTDICFHSWMPAQRKGIQVAGGFHVIDGAPDSCTVVHYEQCHPPFALRSIAFAWPPAGHSDARVQGPGPASVSRMLPASRGRCTPGPTGWVADRGKEKTVHTYPPAGGPARAPLA